MSESKLNLFSFSGKTRILHLSWFAFFLTFVVWFSHAPLMASIRETFGLSDQEVKMLLILNVALTIPARIIIGMLVDAFGPRRIFSMLLFVSSFLCFGFAFADDFETLAMIRFLLGFVGAGFVIGIRMISEWFPAREVGLAEGIYGGWGNFGSAAAALTLPTLALWYGGDDGWRYAVATTGAMILIYSVVYFFSVTDTPKGSTYFKPKKNGAMEISSRGDFFLYLLMNIPLYAALALLTWKLGPSNLKMLGDAPATMIYASLIGLYIFQTIRIYQINSHVFNAPVPEIERYKFKQVAVLDLAYFVTFGSELAVVSMLPLFFMDTFELSIVQAGMLASGYAFMNLVARASGGLASDKIGRKKSLAILITGLSIGYFVMSQIDSSWPITVAVLVTMGCSFFVQSGEGAVFAMVPLVKRRMTGQIAGMAGAYGNVGAVTFLTILSFVSPSIFFMVIGGAAIVVLAAVLLFLDEPAGQMAEVMPDGTVQMIDVA
ncbi:MFS transporter [Solemya pervernicosa gill symbiont]|uniref:Nitrate/nitrite transporter n=2 Tax=Gammaproteobacteria incertae sedis TaxID=118884 RepID=A0A1T2L3D4_9GAMM|nr:NarK family nitrate/nitrite MFS transporter [Candidatus Reidiella endopervernicosa]OOZ39594.1 MFS transporter [Solemya pervernicosa gill symbiont]QKQ27848.1 NarK family nitrate/nitrite MFS transporter [Candidatus Reidiella endopervernicosa]